MIKAKPSKALRPYWAFCFGLTVESWVARG